MASVFVENEKEINALMKAKLRPITKKMENDMINYGNYKKNGYTQWFCSYIDMFRGKVVERVFNVRQYRRRKEDYRIRECLRRIEGNTLCCKSGCLSKDIWGHFTCAWYVYNEEMKSPYNAIDTIIDKTKVNGLYPFKMYDYKKDFVDKYEDFKYCGITDKLPL